MSSAWMRRIFRVAAGQTIASGGLLLPLLCVTAPIMYVAAPAVQAQPVNAPAVTAQRITAVTAQRLRQSRQLFQRGRKLYQRGKLEAAATVFQQAQQLNPQFEHAYALGVTYLNSLKSAKAIPAFQAAIRLNPRHASVPFAYSHMGKAYLNLRQYPKAVAAYQQAVQRLPKNANFHENLGIAYHFNRQLPEAVQSYQRSLQIRPNNPDIRAVLKKARGGRQP